MDISNARDIREVLVPVSPPSEGGAGTSMKARSSSDEVEYTTLVDDRTVSSQYYVTRNMVIDLNGHNFTINNKSGYGLLVTGTCTVKNGTLASSIQIGNGGILMLENVNVIFAGKTYAINVESGQLSVDGDTSITSIMEGIVIDPTGDSEVEVYGTINSRLESIVSNNALDGSARVAVNIHDGAVIESPIKYAAANTTLTIDGGSFDEAATISDTTDDSLSVTDDISISGGTFDGSISTPNASNYITGGRFKQTDGLDPYIATGYALSAEADDEGYYNIIQQCVDGHTFGDWIVTVEPTTNSEGTQMRECSVCGHQETQSIPMKEETTMEFTFNPAKITTEGAVATLVVSGLSPTDTVEFMVPGGEGWTDKVNPDEAGFCSVNIDVPDDCPDGTYDVNVRVVSQNGLQSDTYIASLPVERENVEPPVQPTDTMVHFTEAQIQAMVTMIFRYVNSRISERIVQQVVANDTNRVVSGGAMKLALDALDTKITTTGATAKTYTDDQIAALRALVTSMNHWDVVSVTGELPAEPAEKTIYLQRDSEDDQTWVMSIAVHDEGGETNWIVVGDTTLDLQNYWAKDNVDGLTTALFANDAFKAAMDSAVQMYTDATFIKNADLKTVLGVALADADTQAIIFNSLADKVIKKDNVDDANSVYDLIKSKLYEKGNTSDMMALVDALSITSVEVRTRLLNQLAADHVFGEDTSAGFDSRYWKRTDVEGIRDAMVDTQYFFNMRDKASWFNFFNAIVNDTYMGVNLGLHTNNALLDQATPALKKLGAMLWPELRAAAGMPTLGDDGTEIGCTSENMAQAIRLIASSTNHWDKSDESVAELRERLNIPDPVVLEPISNDKIVSIVNNAFANTTVNLEVTPD